MPSSLQFFFALITATEFSLHLASSWDVKLYTSWFIGELSNSNDQVSVPMNATGYSNIFEAVWFFQFIHFRLNIIRWIRARVEYLRLTSERRSFERSKRFYCSPIRPIEARFALMVTSHLRTVKARWTESHFSYVSQPKKTDMWVISLG